MTVSLYVLVLPSFPSLLGSYVPDHSLLSMKVLLCEYHIPLRLLVDLRHLLISKDYVVNEGFIFLYLRGVVGKR